MRSIHGTRAEEVGLTVPRPSFDDVYDAYFDTMWRTLRGLGVPDHSLDDCAQEVFLVVHRRLPDFEGRSSLKTWLYGIALGVVRNHRRRVRRKGGLGTLDEISLACPAPGPLEAMESAQAMTLVQAIVDRLPEEKRTAFVLAELEQMSGPEIAEVLGVKLNTVYSRLRAARTEFQVLFDTHYPRQER